MKSTYTIMELLDFYQQLKKVYIDTESSGWQKYRKITEVILKPRMMYGHFEWENDNNADIKQRCIKEFDYSLFVGGNKFNKDNVHNALSHIMYITMLDIQYQIKIRE